MSTYQSQVIGAQINLLLHIRETHIDDLTVNQVGWIDDDVTYIEVKYLNATNDSDRAEQYRQQKPESIGFLDALHILSVRLNNTIQYLGEIKDLV